jgi:hypothetical protein
MTYASSRVGKMMPISSRDTLVDRIGIIAREVDASEYHG